MSESPDANLALPGNIDTKKRPLEEVVNLREFADTRTLLIDGRYTKDKRPKNGSNTSIDSAPRRESSSKTKQATHNESTKILTVRARDSSESNSTILKKAKFK